MIDIRPGDTVIYRRTKRRAAESGMVEKANRINLKLVADYQLGAVGIGEVIKVRFSLPRNEVDEVWRDGKKLYDSGRKSVGLSE